VFGVMKKTVIHHSDYQSAHEMKSAISQHFRERNAHFKDDPRRAGKKIWEIDFFRDHRNLPSGNRANAWRWVCGLMRGRRIFLRDICFAIFYPRGRD
jgi:hypothetical protein